MSQSLVQLYCYDLSGGMAANMSKMLIGEQLDAIWHTAIVVYQKEFYFDGGTGIVFESPGKTRFGQPRRVEVLGETTKTEAEFNMWTQQQRGNGFGPNDYSLLDRNCNHFTQEAARFLVNRDIPDEIRNMIPKVLGTPLGRMLRPLLESVTAVGKSAPPSTMQGGAPPTAEGVGLYSTRKQLTEAEEEDLMVALAMLQSNEFLSSGSQEGLDITRGAIALIRTSLLNILEQPTDPKYRGLLTTSQSYRTKLLPLEKSGVVEIFRLSGFRLRQHPSGTGQQWYLSDADGSEEILSIMIAYLNDLMDAVNGEAPVSAPVGKTSTCDEVPHDVQEIHPPEEVTEKNPGDNALQIIQHDAGQPLCSLKELEEWSATKPGIITPAVACRRRVFGGPWKATRLLVCHDMCGGYNPSDYARFALCDASSSVARVVDTSYTVSYWNLVDYFVYFSHHRVSIPPKEWINAAHREGVPMLGTFITEWDASDIYALLDSANAMDKFIHQLVELCNAYNFDGYLINIENSLVPIVARRLVAFLAKLQHALNNNRPPSSIDRTVIWYDAVTITGQLNYQNSLTPENKPFFDVSNGLFTNYGWNPRQLPASAALAGDRARAVYVGVDVFGRSQMYGGGGYDSGKAAECAERAKLSVALFAPGWTLEVEGKENREIFLRADAKMWFGLQEIFEVKHVEYDSLPLWSCFRSGVGKQFYVNGKRVVGGSSYATEWCQLSRTHFIPCYRFSLSWSETDSWCVLPLEGDDDNEHSLLPVEWITDPVWMGDRSIRFNLPPAKAVTLMRSKISLAGCSNINGVLAFIDTAWWRGPNEDNTFFPHLRVEGGFEGSISHIILDEKNAPDGTGVVVSVGGWYICRYAIPAITNWSYITSVSVLNTSLDQPLSCTLGGVGFLSSDEREKFQSLLLVGQPQKLSADQFSIHLTKQPTVVVVEMNLEQKAEEETWINFLLLTNVLTEEGTSVYVYMGEYEKKATLQIELRIPASATVKELLLYPVSPGS
ncbi:endo-beta-N-acetylglucosaminidase, putative [Trypanosoma cruzi marinkellei]|uniref:Endo-beta-N-acetylglucosaminidase, putative n=1 Tax=Trypanosoma cruzi marinkellei TaxID=85056 RepID=K2NBV5_TRYCR|nr:endo-beta-N-acetylglucosaminidase, putative [Trypanosoma cruzi marinkellei]